MKKSISINIQGIIFNVEEDAYEILRKYIDDLREHFKSYKDKNEILNDIEARIAEIFQQKLSKTKEVITLDDVESVINTLGKISDFNEDDASDEKESTKTEPKTEDKKPNSGKRLFRDEKRKILGGVASGIANHFGVDPLWIRLIFVVFVVGISVSFYIPFINVSLSSFSIISYILLWILLPSSKELDDNINHRVFRDEDDALISGVASGLAKYIGIDTIWVRLAFIAMTFFGGSGILIYIILFFIMPEAKTVAEKVQMQGKPLTIDNIEEKIKSEFNQKDKEETVLMKILLLPLRIIAVVFKSITPMVKNLVRFVVNVVRFSLGIGFISGALLMLFILLVIISVTLGLSLDTAWISGNFPIGFFTNSVSVWGVVGLLFTVLIPSVFVGLVGINLLANKNIIKPILGGVLFSIWMISVVMLTIVSVKTLVNFKVKETVVSEKTHPYNYKTLTFDTQIAEESVYRFMDLNIEKHTDSTIKVVLKKNAYGRTTSDAKENAEQIVYTYAITDSTINLNSNFNFEKNAKFRVQNLEIVVYVPENVQLNFTDVFKSEFNDSERSFGKTITIDIDTETQNAISAKPDKTYKLSSSISKLDISDKFLVTVVKSDSNYLSIRGEANLLKDVEIKEKGNTLYIDYSELKILNMDDESENISIIIGLKSLTDVAFSDALKAKISGFNENEINFELVGAVECIAKLNVQKINAELAGASTLNLEGTAKNIDVELVGASKLNSFNMVCENVDLEMVGASNANVNAQNTLNIDAAGACGVSYSGNAKVISEMAGASTVQKIN